MPPKMTFDAKKVKSILDNALSQPPLHEERDDLIGCKEIVFYFFWEICRLIDEKLYSLQEVYELLVNNFPGMQTYGTFRYYFNDAMSDFKYKPKFPLKKVNQYPEEKEISTQKQLTLINKKRYSKQFWIRKHYPSFKNKFNS